MSTAGGHAAAQEDAIVLVVRGQAGVRVEGECSLRIDKGEIRETIAAAVPFERRWQGTGLRCELRSDGPATIEVARGGSTRSRTSTSSGGRAVIEVR